ncbi:MAG: DUF6531 domain-containing protein, partial [Acidiferrobacteraceae bacterium]
MKQSVKMLLLVLIGAFVLLLAPPCPADSLSAADASLYAVTPPPTAPGQSATLLPDGDWLLLGGVLHGHPSNAAALFDPETGLTKTLSATLNFARAWQTATVLPDGTVFIFGGIGSDGAPVNTAERYDPATGAFQVLPATGLTARAHQIAHVLTDGRVLIAGGQHDEPTEIWDPRTNSVTAAGPMVTPRADAESALLSTDPVLLWGGFDSEGNPVASSEWYVPALGLFQPADPSSRLLPPLATLTMPPEVAGSLPADGATGVDPSALLAVRFSTHLDVRTLNTSTVTLIGPTGTVAARVVPAEEGLLLFVTPTQELQPSSSYTLFIEGATDRSGAPLAPVTIGFSTASLGTPNGAGNSGAPVTDQGISVILGPPATAQAPTPAPSVWQPPPAGKPWTLGPVTKTPAANQPLLKAPPGVTALSGQVLLQNGAPLPGVDVSVGNQTTVTDSAGRFLVSPIPAGHVEFIVDGRTANTKTTQFGQFVIGAEIQKGVTHTLSYTVWMPVIDTAHAVSLPSPTTHEVDVTSPLLPGVVLKIPPGVVFRGPHGHIVTSVSLTPVPLDRSPFPLPPFSMYFVIQPGGAVVESGGGTTRPSVQLVYPNTPKQPPGSPVTFMYYDPSGPGWTSYGQGHVSSDGHRIDPDAAVRLYSFSGFGDKESLNPPPPKNPPPGGCAKAGEPVDCYTGVFIYHHTDLVVPDTIPIVIRRTYQSSDTYPRDFGIGWSHDYHMYLYTDYGTGPTNVDFPTLTLVFSDGSTILYTRTPSSPTAGLTGIQMTSAPTPTRFYGSTITYDGTYLVLTLKDGTEYKFNSTDGRFLRQIVNRNGQTLQVIPGDTTTTDNTPDVMIVSPNGRWVTIQYASNDLYNYPAGTSEITRITDNSGRSVSYTYDTNGRLTSATDPDGGVEHYTYVGTTDELQSVIRPNGQTWVTNVYDTNGRVIQQTLADGGTYSFSYVTNSAGQVTQTTVTDPDGNQKVLSFNSAGYVTSVTRAAGTPIAQTTSLTRDATSNLITSTTDALGRTTDYTYDTMGNLTDVTWLAGTPNAVTVQATYTPAF